MTTKVLLIYPTPSISSPQKSPPLSILYVGEALREAKSRGKSDEDFKIRYFDERWDREPDMNWPDIVGVSSMTGYQIKGTIRWLKLAKMYDKRTILGGIHATMQPEQCLAEKYIDSVVVGAGEWAILDAIGGARLASRPLEGEHVSPVNQHTLVHFRRSAQTGDTILLTSRGCPFRCGFCFNQQFYHRHWESVDLDRWKADVLYLKEKAGVTKYEHGDDWIGKWDRAREIIRFLYDNGIEYRPSLRAHQITDEVAYEMKELGIKHVSIGMESGSERILKLIQKDIDHDDQVACALALSHFGIWPLYYWIVGFPSETEEDVKKTLDAADQMATLHRGRLTQNLYAYVALPGTPLFDMVDKSKLPQTLEGWSDYSLNQTTNELASNLYHIGGFHFHKGKGDKTDRNFPGAKRLLIKPFELLMDLRWRLRYFDHFGVEKRMIEGLLKWATETSQ